MSDDDLDRKAIIRYYNGEWSTLHSFQVYARNQLGIAIAIGMGGSGMFIFAEYSDSNVSLTKVHGQLDASYVNEGGFCKITCSFSCAMCVIIAQ